MTEPCKNPAECGHARQRRWSFRSHTFTWLCAICGRVFPENEDGTPSTTPLRGDPDPSIICPLCQSPMSRVEGRRGPFNSCSRHGAGCKGTRQIPQEKVSQIK